VTKTTMEAAESLFENLDPSLGERMADGSIHDVMARLRREAPVHYCRASAFGPFWSVTRHDAIQEIELATDLYSSKEGVSLNDGVPGEEATTFVMMDPPDHTGRRRALAPAFAPSEMKRLSGEVHRRTRELLDSLPRTETFDWVQAVSKRLTSDMLAILFDFPWEDRNKLVEWADWIISPEAMHDAREERAAKMDEMVRCFAALWQQRSARAVSPDLISRMIHSDQLKDMDRAEFFGTLVALVVGGNDTTRNTMSGLVLAFARWPEEWRKIAADPTLIRNAALEAIRWQSPATYMRRTVTRDTKFRGQHLHQGDKVVLWYISANRDEDLFSEGERFIADRPNAKLHLGFGHGVHRCVGARIAELQIEALLAAMAERDIRLTIDGPVLRKAHHQLPSIDRLPVRIGGA